MPVLRVGGRRRSYVVKDLGQWGGALREPEADSACRELACG